VTQYLIDTNILIEAKDVHYGFDFCPAFWDWLIERNHAGTVASVKQVADELRRKNDELKRWATARGAKFFLRPDQAVYQSFDRVEDWARRSRYTLDAVEEFLQVADCWLVARALAYKDIIVTHEVPSDSTHYIKIPDACIALGIKKPMNPYDMLRREGARFILGPNRPKAVA